MTKDEELSILGDSRLINLTEHIIYPYLDKKVQSRIAIMCGKFANGETNFVADVGYLSAISDLKNDLKQKQKIGKTVYAKNNKE
jgi:hypothetical protein